MWTDKDASLGAMPCGYYTFPPEFYGVLLDPTDAEERRARERGTYVTVHRAHGGGVLTMEAGDGPDRVLDAWAALLLLVSTDRRMSFPVPGESILSPPTPHDVYTGVPVSCLAVDAVPLALCLLELRYNNATGTQRLLQCWLNEHWAVLPGALPHQHDEMVRRYERHLAQYTEWVA